MATLRWLLLEPYYDGSHRSLADGLVQQFGEAIELWTMPARKWKWRLRGSSFHFARRFHDERPKIDAILASSMCNLAELRALLPASARSIPALAYFHENQLAYPAQNFDRRDHHFAFTQLHSAASAERVIFNSEYNRSSFLQAATELLGKMPDHSPSWLPDSIASKSQLLPVPLDLSRLLRLPRSTNSRPHIVWNHRWEHDKGPRLLLGALRHLVQLGLDFEISVIGQQFSAVPEEFDEIKVVAGDRIKHWGFIDDRSEYEALLASAHIALSTAEHEFQGLSVLEAAAAGAVPLLPDDLVYREIWPREFRCDRASLAAVLADRVRNFRELNSQAAREIAAQFDWTQLRPAWDECLSSLP